jgi:hypothetical protein
MSASIAASHAASSATALRSQSAPLEPRTITHCTASLYENLRELKRKEDQELLRRPLKEYGLFNPHNTKQSINIDELKKLARHWKLHHQISGFWKLHTTEQQLANVLLKHMVNAHLFQEPVHKAVVEEPVHMRRPVKPAASRRRSLRLETGSSSGSSTNTGGARLFRPYNGDLFSTHEDGLMLMSRFAKPEVAAVVVAAAPVAAVLPAATKGRTAATMLNDDSSERGRRVLSNSSMKDERPGRVLSNSSKYTGMVVATSPRAAGSSFKNTCSKGALAAASPRAAGSSIKSSSSKGTLAAAAQAASRAELSRYRSAGDLSTLSISSSESCFDEAQEQAEIESIAAAKG